MDSTATSNDKSIAPHLITAEPATGSLRIAPGMGTPLSKREATRLVEQIRKQAIDLAALLRQLRERQGWKVLGYTSWAECCEEEFGYSKNYANRLIKADAVRGQVVPIGTTDTPMPESHARELARLPEDQQADCYADACDQSDGKPTATQVRAKVELYLADNEPYVDLGGDHPDDAGTGTTRRGVGIERAHEAIACLNRIPKNDALRVRGAQVVLDWIRHNVPEADA